MSISECQIRYVVTPQGLSNLVLLKDVMWVLYNVGGFTTEYFKGAVKETLGLSEFSRVEIRYNESHPEQGLVWEEALDLDELNTVVNTFSPLPVHIKIPTTNMSLEHNEHFCPVEVFGMTYHIRASQN